MAFTIREIPDDIVDSMKQKNIWITDCPVPIARLRLIDLEHYNFDQKIISGKIIVHEIVAKQVLAIFQELLAIKFPIEKVVLIDEYNGSDENSMVDNNSSCFNHRKILGSDVISMHSYGLAIDINPVQNPYIIGGRSKNDLKIWPAGGVDYLNRANQRPGMVEQIVPIFAKYGFGIWGGKWDLPIDYHHFQVDRAKLTEFVV